MTNKLIIITGPTASGKSDFAIEIANKFDGEIISADSQQIYKEMNIGTNKIKNTQMQGIRHYMLDIKDPNEEYSVQEFKKDARSLIEDINERGKLPILAGGTGFYIDSILFDMNYGTSKRDEKLREELSIEAKKFGNQYLYDKLRNIDPIEAKKYHPNEVQRVIRALETYKLSGKKPSQVRKGLKKLNSKINPLVFFINYQDRSKLYKKINDRVEEMLNLGLEEEFDFIVDKYELTSSSKSLQAIGYKEFFPYKNNCYSYDILVKEIKKNTRRYAKRQITWMKKYLKYDFTNLIYRDTINDCDITNKMNELVEEFYDIQ